jgi:hypothetical protein
LVSAAVSAAKAADPLTPPPAALLRAYVEELDIGSDDEAVGPAGRLAALVISELSGQPHLDTYGLFVTWLLVEQGFTPQRVAAVCSANRGAFVNAFCEEKHGRLARRYVGSLTVLDLHRPTTVRREDLRTLCGWSPFEGVTFPGSVAGVFVRGRRLACRKPAAAGAALSRVPSGG